MTTTLDVISKILKGSAIGTECGAAFAPYVTRILDIIVVRSFDPNDKRGPQGVGPLRYVSGAPPWPYAIYFENQPTATAAAQSVTVTDQLDVASLDITTFYLGPMGFGTRAVVPPPGLTQYSDVIDLRPEQNLTVAVSASLDKSSGMVKWHFLSLDPSTGQPPTDPLAGFLLPNLIPPQGDGQLLFYINPKAHLGTGQQISNRASVIFDANPPIVTPVWTNTIDATPPVSNVNALAPTQSGTSYLVSWQGSDQGAGIQDYSIYSSDNGGAFTAWQTKVTSTSASFKGVAGHTHRFYAIARDLVGNIEAAKTTAEASTMIVLPPSDMTGLVTHAGAFAHGSSDNSFRVWVSNVGPGATTGATAVQLALPAGVYITGSSLSGSGWSCTLSTLACTRADRLLAGANYPPITLVTQIILNTSVSSFELRAAISGGNDANPSNNTVTDRATSYFGPTAFVDVTITTVPAGLQVLVDGAIAKAPRTISWQPGSSHTVKALSPQPSPYQNGKQYTFETWSDGGASGHNVVAPDAPGALVVTMTAP